MSNGDAMPRVVVSRRIFPQLIDELQREFDVLSNQDDVAWNAAQSWRPRCAMLTVRC